jgi:serine-type D-Ala-D-Ala carboxypeptidase/endopeptidase (penicillin-binding protein 4)
MRLKWRSLHGYIPSHRSLTACLAGLCLLWSAVALPQGKPLPPLPIDDEETVLPEVATPDPIPAKPVEAPADSAPPVKPDEAAATPDPVKQAESVAPEEPVSPPEPVEPVAPGNSEEVVTPVGPVAPLDRTFGCEETFPGDPPPALQKKIDKLLANKDLIGGKLSVLAVAYPEGTIVYDREANLTVNPASVTKLFTAAAVLARFGPDHRWQTEILVGEGDCPDLYLVGGGDPGLFEDDVKKLVDGAKAKGVTCVDHLYYDVSLFDDAILPPHYEEKKSDAHWRPKIGALGMCDGNLNIRIFAGDYPGAVPRVTVEPSSSCVMIDSRALTVETVEEGKNLAVSVRESKGNVVVQVTGQIPMKRQNGVMVRKAIPHPDYFTACYARDLMRSRGIKVKQKKVAAGKVPPGAKSVATLGSNTLKTDLRRMQRWSKNYVAEQFVKLMGEGRCTPLTFKCGLRVVRQTLSRFHLNHRCLQMENGSGLFDANRVSAGQVVRLLIEVANQKEWGDLYRKALPLGGKSGTLKERMKKVKRPVRAKTGTLDYHSSIAGYIERRGGGYIAFAILMAETKTTAYRMRRIQDQVVGVLATFR